MVELQDLQEFDVGKEDEEAEMVAIELIHEGDMLQLHVAIAKSLAEDIKQLVCDKSFVEVEADGRNCCPYNEPLNPGPVGSPVIPSFQRYLSNISECKVDNKDAKENHESIDSNASPSERDEQSDWIQSPVWPNASA